MANKTIPQLPEQTGKTDNDLLAIVDSGETTTSKIKVSTLLAGVGGATFFSADTTDNTNILQKDRGHSITYGTGPIQDNFFLGGSGNAIDATVGTAQSYYRNVLLGGLNNKIRPDFSNASWPSSNTAVIAGSTNTMGRDSDNSVIMGGNNNLIGYGEDNAIIGGQSNNVTGNDNVILGGSSSQSAGNQSSVVGGFQGKARANYSGAYGGYQSQVEINSNFSVIVGGQSNYMGAGGFTHSGIIAGNNNEVQHDRSVVLGGQNLTSLRDDEVLVPNLTIANYASLNFADDSAAATGGVPLGGVYHTSGALKIRIT